MRRPLLKTLWAGLLTISTLAPVEEPQAGEVVASYSVSGYEEDLPMYMATIAKRCGSCSPDARASEEPHALHQIIGLGTGEVLLSGMAFYGIYEGDKQCRGDLKTPEGIYYTDYINKKFSDARFGPWSVVLDYPTAEDRRDEACHAGSAIAVHGGIGRRTAGCIRLVDNDKEAAGNVHVEAIDSLVELLHEDQRRTPFAIVDELAPGCIAPVGDKVEQSCLDVLRELARAGRVARPSRAEVKRALLNPGEREASSELEATSRSDLKTVYPEAHRRRPDAAVASSEAPVCIDVDGSKGPCAATNSIDSESSTAWCEGVPGDGVGERLLVGVQNPVTLTGLRILAGYQKSASLHTRNGAPSRVAVTAGGVTESFELDARFGVTDVLKFDSPQDADKVEILITEVRAGTAWTDTCISTVVLEVDP